MSPVSLSPTPALALLKTGTGRGACRSGDCEGPWSLRTLFRAYRGCILVTYGFFNLENLLRLAQPLVLGLAINGLLRGSYCSLLLFAAQHFAFLLLSAGRRMYDTRAFTRIYTDLATRLVLEQRGRDVEVSRVAARSALSREYVSFFERDVPVVFHAVYSLAGSLVMVALYDWLVVPLCLALVLPVCLLNAVYGRRTFALNGLLNDELEREVEVINRGRAGEVSGHYGRVARWRVKLADWEALNFGLTEVLVLGALAAALVHSCSSLGGDVGAVFAVFQYMLMFVSGLDGVPLLVRQISRLRDIARRMHPGPA
jgi:ABC-type multidrug transport system fused ATPase/permease subunit